MTKCLSAMWLLLFFLLFFYFFISFKDDYVKYNIILPHNIRIKLNTTKWLGQKKSKIKAEKYSESDQHIF